MRGFTCSLQSMGAARKTKTNYNDFFLAVKTYFPEYERFRAGAKRTEEGTINMFAVRTIDAKIGKSYLFTEVVVGESFFQVELSPKAVLKYQFKIFCRFYGNAPCLRFDSRGMHHKNEEDGSGLPALRVPPPHFHKVDKDGWMRAYHTSELTDPQSADAIAKDLTLGLNSFCREFNLSDPSGGSVVLKTIAAPLPASSAGSMDAANFPTK